jgi:hypothetical protein
MKDINETVNGAIKIVAAQAQTHVTKKIKTNKSIVTSNLINSITYSTDSAAGEMGGKTDGKELSKPEKMIAKIGTTVVYAPRVEFGFVGTDSLGRKYNQAPKSFLRSALKENEKKLQNLFALVIKLGGKQ